MTIKELTEKRLKAWERGQEIIKTADADKENRETPGLNPEERQEFDRVTAEMDELKVQIDAAQEEADTRARFDAHGAELEEFRSRTTEDGDVDVNQPDREERSEFKTPEQRAQERRAAETRTAKALYRWATDDTSPRRIDLSLAPTHEMRSLHRECRAQSVGTDSEGGYTGPQGFLFELEKAMLAFGGIRQSRARILRTATGNQLEIPMYDDTGNTGALLAENTQDGEQDIVFNQALLDAYKYTSRIIRVSVELMQDSAFDMAAEIGGALGERLGRIQNTQFTTGTGTSQPQGVVVGSVAGKTAASATAITFLELMDLQHSVDPAYRGSAEFMFNDSTFSAIRQLVDGNGFPIWMPSTQGLSGGPSDRFLGTPYVINQDMASITNSAKTVLYGDFSKFYVRDVLGITLVRMDERYADYHQVAFVAISRNDSVLVDAGTNPIKHLIQLA